MTHPQVPWWTQLQVQKWKQRKEKELGHTPWLVALQGWRGVLELWDGTRKIDKQFSYSHEPAQTKQQVG
jgi:hypothetical protein